MNGIKIAEKQRQPFPHLEACRSLKTGSAGSSQQS